MALFTKTPCIHQGLDRQVESAVAQLTYLLPFTHHLPEVPIHFYSAVAAVKLIDQRPGKVKRERPVNCRQRLIHFLLKAGAFLAEIDYLIGRPLRISVELYALQLPVFFATGQRIQYQDQKTEAPNYTVTHPLQTSLKTQCLRPPEALCIPRRNAC